MTVPPSSLGGDHPQADGQSSTAGCSTRGGSGDPSQIGSHLPDTVAVHKAGSAVSATVAVVTVSTSRDLSTDKTGAVIAAAMTAAGHRVIDHCVVPDQAPAIAAAVEAQTRAAVGRQRPDVLILNGGTGLAPSDVTIETVRGLLTKEMTGFAMLMMWLSYQQVGPAAMLSRTMAGTIGSTVVYCLPGSPKACSLAVEMLITPEVGHILKQLKP